MTLSHRRTRIRLFNYLRSPGFAFALICVLGVVGAVLKGSIR